MQVTPNWKNIFFLLPIKKLRTIHNQHWNFKYHWDLYDHAKGSFRDEVQMPASSSITSLSQEVKTIFSDHLLSGLQRLHLSFKKYFFSKKFKYLFRITFITIRVMSKLTKIAPTKCKHPSILQCIRKHKIPTV